MASVARKDPKRFSSLNLGTTYKGAKPEAKGAGNKGGFQSLGKIQGKRMPGPAQLPSLRKENAGNDPNVNLVPQAGSGWGAGKEDEPETKEPSNQPPSSQPVTQSQDIQPATQQSVTGREASVKKEGIWATPEANSVGPTNVPPNQQFKKNFPSLEEREARGTKRTIPNELHHESGPFNEMDNISNVPAAIPPSHYHYGPRPRAPYPGGAPSHMPPHYLPRNMPPFRHGIPPAGPEYNHYGHHGGSYRGYPQQQPGPPPNSAAGGQYYPVPRYPLHHNSSLPHNMDPYQDNQSKLVKNEELKNLELPDEDDDVGGWAGYHEEVDYSKKVVFNDSSDDEEREGHQEHQQQRQPKRKEIQERESTGRDAKMQEAPPLATVEQPHLHAEQPTKHLHTAPADLQYFQQQHPQGGASHYPLYYASHPHRGYPITVASRPVEKERPHPLPQPDLQPIWQQSRRGPKGIPPPESAWGEDKLVTAPAVTQSSTVHNIVSEQMDTIQQQLEQTTLNDNDSNVTAAISAEKKHVTFYLEQQQQQQPATPPAARQPLKIMMRDMKISARDEHEQTTNTEMFHHGNMGKPPYHHRPTDSDHQHVVNVDKSLPQQQKVSAWKAADRGPITTPRTLYEPEGDKSAKKFNALIKQTSSERSKRSSVSDNTQDGEQVQSPSGDIKILKAEEKQSKSKHHVTATTPPDEATTPHNKHISSKSKTNEASATASKKGSKRDRPSFKQYQPPPAREQDEQASYSESKGSGRRSTRQQEYNYDHQHQGDGRSQRRRDRQPSEGKHQQPEGKYHTEGKYQSDKRYSSDSKQHQAEGKPQPEGKQHPEGKRQHTDNSNRRENRPRKERETSKEPPASTDEQTDQHADTPADASKEDASKPDQPQDDKTKQSVKDAHSKGERSSGDTKHRKKSATSSGAAQKSDAPVKEKSRSRGGRNRGSNNEDWYYSDDYYYKQWYASGGYDDYYYYYHPDDYNYYSERRPPSGRQKQQQQSYDGGNKSTSERRDNGGKKSQQQQQQQQSDRGSNRPARTRGADRKDESSDDKGQHHRTTKDKSREVSGEEVPPRSKPAEEADTRERTRRRDSSKQYQDSNVDKKRSSRTTGSKGHIPSTTSTSKSSVSHDPSGRGQSRTSSNKITSVSHDRPQQSDDQQHTTVSEGSSSKKEPAIKDKAASAKMANLDINSPTVFVIDEQTTPLSSAAPESDDFIRVTSKKEKREMKELEKHRQQEKQRKAEEEENKKKQHSTRKSSQKTKHQQHQLQEQSLPHDDQSLSSTTWSTTTTAAVTNASIWTESFTDLLNEGVNQTSYMAAAHSSLMSPGDYQLFPTSSSYSSSSVPLAHLSAAVDSSVAQELPSSAAQGHSLSTSDVKPAGVGRPDTSSAGHGTIRTDLPLSKSHSSTSVGGAIGRGRGSSSSRAPGSNRGNSSSRDSSKKLPLSSSDSKLSASTSPKISKPSTAVRSKPSTATNTLSSSDKVTQSSTSAVVMTTTMAGRKKMLPTEGLMTRLAQDGGSKRAGSQSAGGTHTKSNKQRPSKQPPSAPRQHPVSAPSSSSNTVSYANAVKCSPSLQDKKCPTTNKPVAYVKPTASNAAPSVTVADQKDDVITAVSASVEPLPIMPSFPTAHLSQELMAEEEPMVLTSTDEQCKQVKVTTSSGPAVVVPPPTFVSPVITQSPATAAVSKSGRLTFTPFTFVATPSTSSSVTSHQAVIVPVTTVTSSVTSHPKQSSDAENGKEGIVEVEEVASKRIRLGPVANVQRTTVDHSSTKLNIAAVPFIPSSMPMATHHQNTTNMTTPTVAATPSHKVSMSTACYQLPTATMMPANIMPVIVPHPQMGSGYPMSQQTAYPFPAAVPSHAYPMPTHPPSIVGLAYPGYPMQQPTMVPSAVTNNNVPPSGVPGAANYNVYLPQPVTGSNVMPPAAPFPPAAIAAHHAQMEQRKKEEQMKAVNDTKRFFEQNPSSSVAKQQPQYKHPPVTTGTVPVKQQSTEGGRRTLLENPPVVPMAMLHPPIAPMMNRPLEMTPVSPSTGSKRKRRPPLMPLPQMPTANNVTIATAWDKPTNTLY